MPKRLLHDVPVRAALSNDGLVVASSQGLTHEDGEHLSALAAGIQRLARGAGREFDGGEVRQTIVEMELAVLFAVSAGTGTCLAVLTSAEPNAGVIAYEMARGGPSLMAGSRSV